MNKFSDFRLQDKDLQIVQDNIYGSLENQRCLRANILNDAHNGKSQSEIQSVIVLPITRREALRHLKMLRVQADRLTQLLDKKSLIRS